MRLYGWRRRACAPALVLARLCLCATGGVGAMAASHRHRLRLRLRVSVYHVGDYTMRTWMDGGVPSMRWVRSLAARHCEYFNKVGPYCWRSNVLIIHNDYCSGDHLLSRGMNYNLSNIKAPCGIYFKNRLPYAARDIVKILTRDASVDGGASPL